jgi:GNAT superfamily N-acetyltransferase
MELVPVADDATIAVARHLIGDYLSWVAGVAAEHHGLVFDTQAMLASDISDRSKFYPPLGRFYLLRDAQAFVGVGALQRVDVITAEVQRMHVQPALRGRGATRLLLGRLLDDTRAMGCDVCGWRV